MAKILSVDGLNKGITLPDGEAVIFGRSRQTGIADVRCSRKHLELKANYKEKIVTVKLIVASSFCYVDEEKLESGKSTKLRPGQTLYVVGRNYPHRITFQSENEQISAPPMKKRKVSKQKSQEPDEEEIGEKLKKLQQSSLLASSVTSQVDKNTEGAKSKGNWSRVDDSMLVYESEGFSHSSSSRVIAFDLDGTIITTKSGKKFAQSWDDWKLLFSSIPQKLEQLHQQGCKLLIISNQLGISKGKVNEADFKKKIEAIISKIGLPFQVLAAIKKGQYRKPNTGSYEWLRKNCTSISSFTYVGDAAGRRKDWGPGKKKDFSCSDRLFAINLGCEFHTPEEFFLSARKVDFDMPPFDPRSLKRDLPLVKSSTDGDIELRSKHLEVVIFVGYPASGKSSFAKQQFANNGYQIVNQDQLRSKEKCYKVCGEALAAGKSCVIDNTNPQVDTRKRYIEIAKSYKAKCRCFYFDIDINHVFHNNRFRELSGSEHAVVSPMIIYSFRKKLEEPKLNEGFDRILTINFLPVFADSKLEQMYYKFLD